MEEGPMAGKPFLRRGLTWAARGAATVGVALVLQAGGVLAATHYPTGSLCYDCHAVSKSKMVLGTHLIKKSDKTVALGIMGSSTPIRCLFCHEKNAVSVTGRTEMRGVWDHFDATSTSKHPAYVESGFTPDALRFDCLDCHTGITLGVVSDEAGNARVHGIDAATQNLNLYGTLIGSPANAAAVSTATCQNAACHSAAGSTIGGYTAPARHSFVRTFPGTTQRVVTINDSVNPTLCTDCHGRHNSYQNTSLITLRTDGTTSNNPGDPLATRVTPDKCGECHSQDDGGIYTGKGHGQSTISGGTVGCTACHTASVPHSFGAPSTNPLRFAFAENTTKQSAIRQQPPYNQVFSVCLTCHGQYAGKEHGASAYAGCNDCHEPHGLGVLTNVKMIRRQIPKVNASGVPVYGLNSPTGTWEQNFYTVAGDTTFKTDGTGLCDNRECHEGRTVAGDLIYPLSTFLTGGRHSGGNIPTNANYDCETCHTHTDEGGSWGAKASCTTCHGQPPPPADSGYTTYAESNTPHQRHAAATDKGGYGYPCQACHFDYTSTLTHNTSPKTYQSLNFDVARNSSPARSYSAGTCTNLYCHSDGQRSTSVGSAQWMTGTSTPDWRTQDLACNSCHGTTTSPNTLTYGAPDHANGTGGHTPNSHNRHAAYACRVCHFDTLSDANPADGWTLANPPSAHVNNVKNLRADGTTATFTSTGTTPATCNNISCHNGGSAAWGATLGCSDCHFRTAAQGGDLDNFVYGDGTLSAVNSDEWTATGHGRPSGSGAYPSGNPAGNFAGPASDPRGCAYCHSFLGTANNPLVAHGVSTNPFRLANKSGAGEDGGWNNVCLVCHKTGDSGYDPDGAAANYASRNGARNVDENHYGVKHTAASKGGTFCWDCHDPHGDSQHYMVQGGAGVTDVSDGLYGIPVTRRAVTGFDVAAGGYTSADLANAANTGLCQTCHASAGGALYYNRSTFTALNLHNGADTQRCTACHTHSGDFGAGCTACHGYPPPDSPFVGTTATWTSDKAATPSSLGAHNTHAAGATPYVSGDCNSTCHTAATHLTNKLTANMGVKAATVGASTGIYKYSTVNNFDNWLGGALPGTQSVVDDTCTNVSCHASTYSANSFRSAANPGYTRYWNQNLNCYACHAYDGVAAAAPRPTADKIATGSHGVHVDTYALACTNCHPSAGYTNAHKSGFVNFAANFGATRVPSATGGAYDADGIAPFTTVANLVPRENGGTGYFCANVYCHSGGEPRGPEAIAYRNDTRWTVVSTGDCGTCHAVDGVAGSGNLVTNVHEKHVGSAAGQYGYPCTACHATVVGGVKPAYTIASTALHVNGANNVAFATNEGTYATTGGTVAPDGGTCSATYCHSQGLDWSAPYTGTATAPVTTADWDAPQGTTGCGYCHGNPPAYANNTTIRPAATNLTKKNSHAAHANYTCDRCHYTTTQNGTTIASLSAHANKAWEVAANTGAGVTFTVAVQGTLSDTAYTPTTCNTISCHGGGNAQWGAALSCADCHFRTTAQGGDLDNWNIADGTASMVNSDEWTAAGHGRSTAYPSGNPAGNFAGPATDPGGCAYCHAFLGTANNPLVTHGVSTNPFRIANKSGTGEDGGWNNVCLVCHKTGSSGYDPDGASANYASRNGARKVDENHYGTKHTAASKGGTFCWDCHDPHGDSQHYMVQGGAGVTDVSDGLYGIPVTRRAVTGFDVAAGGYTSADLVNTNNTGLCQTCHASNGGALYYNRSTFTALNLHNGADGTHCTVCHSHKNDFAPSGCNTCHGGATAGQSPAPNTNWPDSITANTYPDRAGAHAAHVAAIGTGNSSCVTCHPGNPPAGHPDGSTAPARVSNMDLNGDGTPDSDTSARFLTMTGATDTDGRYNAVTQTCLNINCHGNNPTPGWYAGADTTPPVFSPNNTITVTNPGSGGTLQISWNTATDGQSPPVRYDLFRLNNNTTGNACTDAARILVAANLGTTGYADTGLTNGTNYRYCVTAKDNVSPTPNLANTTSAHAAPTAPAVACSPGTGTVYRTVFGAVGGTINDGTSPNPAASGQTLAISSSEFGRQQLVPNGSGTASNFLGTLPDNTTWWPWARFYVGTDYASDTCVGPNLTAGNAAMRATNNTNQAYFQLIDYDPAGPVGNGTVIGTSSTFSLTGAGTTTSYPFTMTFPQYKIPAGHRLVLQAVGRAAAAGNYQRLYIGGTGTTTGTYFTIPVYSAPTDTTPPTFAGLASAVDAGTGGAVNLAWTAATDPSTPVRYTVYALQSSTLPAAATLFQAGNIVQQNITGTTTTVTGLTNGLPYFFGVRATDAANNTETNSVIRPAAAPGVIPTGGGGGGGCTTCHTWPPTSGAHAAHGATGTSPNTDASTCVKCHGDTTAYTTNHGNGLLNFTFTGDTGAAAAYSSNVPGTVNGTCSNVDCHFETTTQAWNNSTNLTCTSCHGATLSLAHGAHTASRSLPQTGQNDCFACHNTVVNSAGAILNQTWGPNTSALHPNGARNVSLNATYATTLTPGGVSPALTCSTVTCHNGSASIPRTTPAWNTTNIACTSCHVIGGGASADPVSGLHATANALRHDDSFNAAPVYTCTSCHLSTDPSIAHNDLTLQNAGATTYNWAATYAITYNRAADTCAATCHTDSNGTAGTWGRKWLTAVDAVPAVTDAATAAVCRNCHGSFQTGWNIIGATDHVNPSAANDPRQLIDSRVNHGECTKCHGWGQAAYTAAMHNGTTHEIQMNSDLGYQDGGALAGQCTTHCHAGLTLAMNTNSGWTTQLVAFGGVGCGDCHNGGVQPGAESGAHVAHGASRTQLVAGGAACVACHGNNGGAGFQNTPAGTHGIGNAVNWAANLTYSQAATRGDLTGTCTGTAGCHVAATNIAWNATPTNCTQCHVNTTDRNDWNGNNNVASMIASGDFTGSGHGAKADVGAAGCLTCHDLAQPHDRTTTLSGTNPYRLRDQDAGTAGVQFSCTWNAAACHDGNPTPSVATVKTHSNEEMANSGYTAKRTWPAWDPQCVNCHDPHGDGNLAMIRRDLYDKAAFNLPAGPAPAVPTEQTSLTFTNRTGVAAGSYSWATEQTPNYSGVCQECHEAANHVAFKDNTSASVTPHPSPGTNPGQCSSCHPHSGAFKPSGCSGCHGDGNNQYWPANAASNLRSAYPNRAGRHQKHMDVLAQRRYAKAASALTGAEQTAICDMCHNDATGVGGGGHYPASYSWSDAPADVGAFNQMWGAYANDTDGAYTNPTWGGATSTSPWTGGSSCSALDCHNSKTTGAGFEWYGATLTACTMCHTRATSGSNPSSGLHYGSTAPTVSGAWHDDTLTATNKCVVCHTTLATQSTHINGAFTGNGTLAADRTAMGLFAAYTNGGTDGVGSCSGAAVGGTGCHVGGDAGTWARRWNSAIHYANTGAECAGCHGGFNNDWTFGTDNVVNDGSVSHDRNWNGNETSGEVIGNHQNLAQATRCNVCHVWRDAPYASNPIGWQPRGTSTYHGDGRIAMNSTLGYSRTAGAGPAFGCSSTCHSAPNSGLENSGWTLELVAGPALSCTSCHTGSGSGALAVGPTSSHTTRGRAAGYNTFNDCTDCHPGGGKGSTHSRTGTFSQSVTYVRNYIGTGQTMLGLNYSGHLVTTGVYGFFLGGSATIGTTNVVSEAEICWGCHTNTTYQGAGGIISEWGQNQKSATGNMTYNYGTVSSPNWVTASWTSAVGSFGYKTGPIRSTHTANPQSLGGPSSSANTNAQANPDTVAQIRCSYCHSVHGRLDSARTNIMTSTPYLRGAWLGNPYLEDGAPLTTAYPANTSTFRFGKVPRGSKARPGTGGLPTYGGYQIDHNNDWPMGTTGTRYTTAEFGGLCEICHGDGNGTFTAAEIGNLNVFDAQGVGWVSGANGHANSVAGAGTTGPAGRNIFDGRGGMTAFSNSPYQHFEGMTDPGDNGSWGFRDADSAFAYQPRLASGATRNRLWSGGIPFWNQWGVFIRTTGAVQGGYHKFPCSKCHNPHASRLPKLMITNCLDTKHNTWDNFYQIASAPGINAGRSISNWTSAQNCHRLPGVANPTDHPAANDTRSDLASSFGRGWNTVTPW
jgi:predicted CxxxxCH...CXXCH cytochrome family protein